MLTPKQIEILTEELKNENTNGKIVSQLEIEVMLEIFENEMRKEKLSIK